MAGARLKTCRACREKFLPARPLQTACKPSCAIELARKASEKKRAEKEKAERVKIQRRKEAIKTTGDYLKEAQAAFNLFIRERDRAEGYPCISSGRALNWNGNAVDAGHYRSTGAAPHLRFDEHNCHAQSKHDNRYLAGNAVDYRINLIERIGLAEVERLEADNTPRHWSKQELIEIRDKYKAKARALKKARGA